MARAILGAKRKDVVLATKFGLPMDDAGELKGASRRYIMHAVEASLRRLNTDWIDLYQLHRPDPQIPIEETLRALDDLVRAGKVRWIGCSNLSARELVEAQTTARRHGLAGFVSVRTNTACSCATSNASSCRRQKRWEWTIALFPAGQRALDRQVRARRGATYGIAAGEKSASRAAVRQRTQLAHRRRACRIRCAPGHTLLELAFSWLLRDSVVASVIAGATTEQQVEQNARAAGWILSAEDLAEIDRITL